MKAVSFDPDFIKDIKVRSNKEIIRSYKNQMFIGKGLFAKVFKAENKA